MTRRSPLALFALFAALVLVALPTAARADDEALVGTYRLGGREGARALSGTIVVTRSGDDLTLSGPLGSKGTVRLTASADGTFEPAAGATVGMAGALTGATTTGPAYTLTLRPGATTGKFVGQVTDASGRKLMTVELTRRRRALVVHAVGYAQDHDDVFRVYAKKITTYYKGLGLEVDMIPADSWDAVIAALRAAGETGAVYTRVATLGHGGWDGPIFHGQISPWWNHAQWPALIEALRSGTAPEAKWLVSACHTGGSDRWEKQSGNHHDDQSWVDEVARASGRTVAGPAGYTSTTFALKQAMALEGAGGFAQETRVASAAGVKVARGWLAAAKLVAWTQVDADRAAAAEARAAAASTP